MQGTTILCFADSITSNETWLKRNKTGGDIYNRSYASMERNISVETVSSLSLKWKFDSGKGITATPTFFYGILYFHCGIETFLRDCGRAFWLSWIGLLWAGYGGRLDGRIIHWQL
ncbi:hypothetical protein VNO80_07927 [Phaseolus coccineus]|uniref:Uncharacterized protein n=1 Tax=Phaseolus coccineus TaxID=3886 RepID=A0AAN9NPB3_PHACN